MLKIIYGQNCVRYAELPLVLGTGEEADVGTPVVLGEDASGNPCWKLCADGAKADGFILSLESNSPLGNVVVAFGQGSVLETDQVTLTGLDVGEELEVASGKLAVKSTGVAVGKAITVGTDYVRFLSYV